MTGFIAVAEDEKRVIGPTLGADPKLPWCRDPERDDDGTSCPRERRASGEV